MSETELVATIMRHLRNWKDQQRTTYYVCDKCRKTNTDMHDKDRLHFLYGLIEKAEGHEPREKQ